MSFPNKVVIYQAENVGSIVFLLFDVAAIAKRINQQLIQVSTNYLPDFRFTQYLLNKLIKMRLTVTISSQLNLLLPAILDSLCKEFLAVNVSAILYLMNHEQYGRSTASAQYFLQLAGYLGIPVSFFNSLNTLSPPFVCY